MGFFKFFFGFKGRIGRGMYWGLQIMQLLLFFFAVALVSAITELTRIQFFEESVVGQAVFYVLFAGYCVMVLSSHARRWHDLGRSGWWQLVAIIPFGGLYVLIMCGFVRGDWGPNDYGPDPMQKDGAAPDQPLQKPASEPV
jgi:uncharacterized membrane protein YhaH (DUF805 family)